VAPTEGWVLISGESGTGKELVARAIHAGSPRADESFVAVNCAAIPKDLVESELFGHQRGAFTGATQTRRGRFEEASGGTLFLDEIGEMPLSAQPKLLRVLEDRRVTRVGGERAFPVDVRVLAATNHDLRSAVRDGTFREDLYHRINVVELKLPPLRDRLEDIPLLCDHFLDFYAGQYGRPSLSLTEEAVDRLRRHRWTGNVRELRNLMERLTILCQSPKVGLDELRVVGLVDWGDQTWEAPPLGDGDAALRATLRDVEQRIIERTLQEESGNVARTARRLGLERSHLYRKLRELGISRDPDVT
jgi:two-component system nitrogen regulation response regulator NtrX